MCLATGSSKAMRPSSTSVISATQVHRLGHRIEPEDGVLGERDLPLDVALADHRLVDHLAAAGEQELGAGHAPRTHVLFLQMPVDPGEALFREAVRLGLAHVDFPFSRLLAFALAAPAAASQGPVFARRRWRRPGGAHIFAVRSEELSVDAHPLDRPVWAALTSRQSGLAIGDGRAVRIDPALRPVRGRGGYLAAEPVGAGGPS
jgi:hypothetical protein